MCYEGRVEEAMRCRQGLSYLRVVSLGAALGQSLFVSFPGSSRTNEDPAKCRSRTRDK